MSEVEKEAIEYLKEHNIPILKYDTFGNLEKIPYYGTFEKETILNLIEKQQKEIEEKIYLYNKLEAESKYLIEKQQKEIEELKKPKYIIKVRDNEFISKDKIRKLIENNEQDIDYSVHDIIDDLRKLLEE